MTKGLLVCRGEQEDMPETMEGGGGGGGGGGQSAASGTN